VAGSCVTVPDDNKCPIQFRCDTTFGCITPAFSCVNGCADTYACTTDTCLNGYCRNTYDCDQSQKCCPTGCGTC
jgi:hypothetical protein